MGENKDSIFSLMNHSIIYNVHFYAHLLNPKQYKTNDSTHGVDGKWEGERWGGQKGREGELELVCKMKSTFLIKKLKTFMTICCTMTFIFFKEQAVYITNRYILRQKWLQSERYTPQVMVRTANKRKEGKEDVG